MNIQRLLPFCKRHQRTLLLSLVLACELVALILAYVPSAPADELQASPVQTDPIEVPHEEDSAPDSSPAPQSLSAPEIMADSPVIAHAMGAVDGVTTLNCLEGFEAMYAQGVRVFEADLRLTLDGEVVLRHDWRGTWQEDISEISIPTLKEFLDTPILGQYTPLSFRDLLLLMEEYPDICIITDTKFTDADIVAIQFDAMLRDAEKLGLTDLFDRMFIQLYNTSMLNMVEGIYHFPHYIYTLYAVGFEHTPEGFEEVAAYCDSNGIEGVTMWYYWWDAAYAPIAQAHSISVYTHTVNNAEYAKNQLSEGVGAVYTDTLTPELLS